MMMNKGYSVSVFQLIACCFIFSSLLLEGCAQPGLYYWGDYEDSLYERYVENNNGQTELHLQETVAEAQKNHQRVPPGLYADYGFMLYKRGDKSGAIGFFEKEKALYPESSFLMIKLIERVKQQKDTGHPATPNAEAAGSQK